MILGQLDESKTGEIAAYMRGRDDYPATYKCCYEFRLDPKGFMAYWNGWNDASIGWFVIRKFDGKDISTESE